MENELIKLENEWNNAVVKRDMAALNRVVADDWTIIDPDGIIVTKAQYLASIKSGEDVFTSAVGDEWKVRVYGDAAVVLQRWTTKEQYKGKDVSGQESAALIFGERRAWGAGLSKCQVIGLPGSAALIVRHEECQPSA